MTSSRDAVRLTPEAMARYIPDAAGNRFHVGLERGQRAKPQNRDAWVQSRCADRDQWPN